MEKKEYIEIFDGFYEEIKKRFAECEVAKYHDYEFECFDSENGMYLSDNVKDGTIFYAMAFFNVDFIDKNIYLRFCSFEKFTMASVDCIIAGITPWRN